MKTFQFENFICKLGNTAKENWQLLDDTEDHHLFFHISAFPSGYVILECEEKPKLSTIQIAAKICKDGTKYRRLKNLKIDYCQCSNLKKGDKVGEVLFKSNKKVQQIKI
jgi:predicted ribosome quality control (RQC) complex YloA/Tae2 family protein